MSMLRTLSGLSRSSVRSAPSRTIPLSTTRVVSFSYPRLFSSYQPRFTPTTQRTAPIAGKEFEKGAPSRIELPFVSIEENKTAVEWNSRAWSKFHHLWLRDHCRCPKCFHAVTKQRLFSTFDIPADIKPRAVNSTREGLEITWPDSDAHVSVYPWSWLKEHSYDPPSSMSQTKTITEKVLWGAKIEQDPPSVQYEQVMAGDGRGLYQWLSKIDQFGFCFVSGVPATPEATEELVTRIGFIRETQYGKFWDFTSDLAKGDTAYTTLALGAHTDTTYFTDPCGLQIFHLLSHTEGSGGSSLLVDGFYTASLLRSVHPRAFEILTRVKVRAHAAGEPDALYAPAGSGFPVITLDQGEVTQVRWNNDDRSVMRGLSAIEVEEWYDAIHIWNKCLTSSDSEYWVQLTPGTVVAIDNHRVLHGRSAFTGKRRMCGAYIGGDEYRSKLTVVRERLQHPSVATLPGGRSVWSPQL